MCKRVLVIGSTCVDVIIRVDHLPKTEENMHPQGQQFRVGGCAYNVANVLGRAGADTLFVTPVGMAGLFGPYVKPILDQQPWARPVVLQSGENGCCYCLVESGGERTFLSIHGTEYTFDPAWMAPYACQSFDYAYVCGLEIGEKNGDTLVAWLEQAPVGTLLYAPGPMGMYIPRDRTDRLLALHPMLHLNQREALMISGQGDVSRAMDQLFERTGNDVIVTLGAQGAMVKTSQGLFTLPGQRVDTVVDTIGAGDAHAGAVLLGLSQGLPVQDAIALANRVSAQVVQLPGATLTDTALKKALSS